jgi:hypothetical protein
MPISLLCGLLKERNVLIPVHFGLVVQNMNKLILWRTYSLTQYCTSETKLAPTPHMITVSVERAVAENFRSIANGSQYLFHLPFSCIITVTGKGIHSRYSHPRMRE